MTPETFWQAIGEQLLIARTRKGWNPIDVQRAGGPTYATVQAIETGRVGTVDSLTKHAAALGLSIVDVVSAVLQRERGTPNPEAAQILRAYSTTSVRGRVALVALAQALIDQEGQTLRRRVGQR